MHSHKKLLLCITAAVISTTGYAEVTDRQNFEFDLRSGDSFELNNVNGNIEVRTGTFATVEATLEASNQKFLDDIEIDVSESSGSVTIDTELPRSMRGGHASVNYIVTLPQGVVLDGIETVNGNIDISDRDGEINAETVNGDIDADNLSGDVELETVNGGIIVDFTALGGDNVIDLETVNGSIKVTLPNDADVSVFAENMNGSMKVDDLEITKRTKSKWTSAQSVEAFSGSGSAELTADTVNGSIRIRKQ